MTPKQHSAVEWLHAYGRRYPMAWESYARALADPPIEWPSWCWCPMSAASAIILSAGHPQARAERDTAALSAVAAWRATQGIYRIHPTLLAELMDTPVTGDLPSEVLTRLPEWCVYVEMPGHIISGHPIDGFWSHLEWDTEAKRAELRILLDARGLDYLVGHAIHLGGTIEAGIQSAVEASVATYRQMGMSIMRIRELRTHYRYKLAPELGRLVSVLLYLCADDAEIGARSERPPKVVRGKKRPICPAAKGPAVHDCGVRIGAALDLARQRPEHAGDGTGATVAPHVRRAHWHSYWRGPRDGERRIVLRWLSPILVGLDGVPAEATVRPVRQP